MCIDRNPQLMFQLLGFVQPATRIRLAGTLGQVVKSLIGTMVEEWKFPIPLECHIPPEL